MIRIFMCSLRPVSSLRCFSARHLSMIVDETKLIIIIPHLFVAGRLGPCVLMPVKKTGRRRENGNKYGEEKWETET